MYRPTAQQVKVPATTTHREQVARQCRTLPVGRGLLRTCVVTLGVVPGLALGSAAYDEARVVRTVPVYETVSYEVPAETCRTERVAYPQGVPVARSATVPLIGAILGGALGNAVGHNKRNKQVGAVVGAVLGGSIGADIARQQRAARSAGETVRYRHEEVCEVVREVHQREQLSGYDVTYVYGGQTYNTIMPHDPGQTLRVRVRVSPAE